MILSLLGSIVSIGFPTIATYKALKANDITLMRPWLMYWSVLSLGTATESALSGVLYYVPFYNLLRLGVLVWLMSAGAVQIWGAHVEPWLASHEQTIDQGLRSLLRIGGQGGAGSVSGSATESPNPNSGDALFGHFRLPLSGDSVLSAMATSWRAPKTDEQARQQRSLLESMIHSLDAGQDEEFVAIQAPEGGEGGHARRRWLW